MNVVVKNCIRCGSAENEFVTGRNHCKICERKRYHDNKEKRRPLRQKYYEKNKKHTKEKSAKWYEENKERALSNVMARYSNKKEEINMGIQCKKYGLTEQQYKKMKDDSKGKCEICGDVAEKMCIDHDHNTGIVRGYICNNCNSAIGFLKEDYKVVEKVVKYLEKTQKNSFIQYYSNSPRSILT